MSAELVARVVSYGVIAGSLTVKVPVILNVRSYRSGLGLSLGSLYLEALSLSCHSAYSLQRGTALSAWAECLSVLAQDAVLVVLLWRYANHEASSIAGAVLAYAAALTCMFGLPAEHLALLPLLATALGLAGSLPQIWANHVNGHTGALSPITQSLNVAGVGARVFTTLQLVTGDSAALASVLVSFVLQLFLMAQLLAMRSATAAAIQAQLQARLKQE